MAMKRAGELSISGSSDLAVKWRVKCVALAKLVYGDQHWKLGQAYGELAQAYLNLKGLPQQAYHHGLSAKEILVSPSSDALKSVDGTMSVIRVYIIIGHASLCLHKYDEAVKAFHKAEKETEKLRKVIEDPPQEFPLQIAIGMGKGLYGIRQYEKSRDVLQKGLVFVRKTKDDRKVISVLQDLADASAGSGDYSLSVSSLEEAQNLVAEEFGEKSEEMAQIEQKLAKALMSTLQVHEQERVLKLMTKAHSTLMELDLKKSAAKCLEEMCKFYVQMGKPEEALLHLKTVIKLKKEAFGDFSAEVGESHRLTGTIYLSQGRMAEANKHLRKSLEILTITLGKKHKCTVEVERILALAAIKGRTKSAVTERPRFKTVFGSEGTSAKSSIDLKSPKKSGPSFDDRPPFSIYLKNDAFW
jgi:tetratricopeptide (TPR) repeat protein